MNHLKKFKNLFLLEHNAGDMVYVDVYGPKTLQYSDSSGTIRSDIPFRPKISNFNFNKKFQYEIVHLDGDRATLFDNDNKVYTTSLSSLYSDKIDINHIKDCFINSFEEILEPTQYKYFEFVNEVLINIRGNVDKYKYSQIYNNEFKPRLESEGYQVYMEFYKSSIRSGSFMSQISIRSSN